MPQDTSLSLLRYNFKLKEIQFLGLHFIEWFDLLILDF